MKMSFWIGSLWFGMALKNRAVDYPVDTPQTNKVHVESLNVPAGMACCMLVSHAQKLERQNSLLRGVEIKERITPL